MPYQRNLEPAGFALAVAFSRISFRSHELYDLDSVNFALGMARFDPQVHQPHPPGYFLYICCGRWLAHFIHDPNLALVLLSTAASCGTIVFIYLLALKWFDPLAARFAALLFLLSPLAWFHGTVALTYSVEAFFSALTGYLCWRVLCGDYRWIPATSLTLGISAGIRPSSLLLLLPLCLFALFRAPVRRKAIALVVLAIVVAAWFVPMLLASGGPRAYFYALDSLWRLVPSKTTAFNSSPVNSIARAITIVFIYLLTFGAGSLAPFAGVRRATLRSREFLFSVVWTAPALCVFTLIFLKFVNSGYLLLLAAPGSIWLGRWLSEWYRESRLPLGAKRSVIVAGAAVNVAVFLFSPLYCSYRSVRRFESQLCRVNGAMAKVAAPGSTLIVAFDSHFLGFRHAGYSLPQYLTVEYPEVVQHDGTRVFVMRGRNTSLLSSLPTVAYERFIFYPLPQNDPSYQKYLESVEAKLPPAGGIIRVVHADGVDFITGPISCLSRLFPKTSAGLPGDQCVSGVSVEAPPVYNRAHPGER
jgi:4-amino-4-deoxy-L-arabinose transferase-like glycosyltransferase